MNFDKQELSATTQNSCNPETIYLFKFNIRNTRKRCGAGSKLTKKTMKLRHWCLQCSYS